MTEFAVGASTLALLLLGSLAIAGYQEADRRSALSARRAAWQESWVAGSASNEAGREAIHAELFADVAMREPTGRRLQVSERNLAITSVNQAPQGLAGTTTDVLLAPLRVASGFLDSGFDLSGTRMARGQVVAHLDPLESFPAPFDKLELDLTVPFALLGDAWQAAGPEHVHRRASGLVPTGRLAAINSIWQPLSIPLGILEPSLRELCLGIIEPDRIPEDRLGPGRNVNRVRCP